MNYTVDITQSFEDDISAVIDCIAHKLYNLSAAERLLNKAEKTISQIGDDPLIFPLYHDEDIVKKAIYIASPKGDTFYPATVSDFKYSPIEMSKFILSRYSNGSMIWQDFLSENFFPPIMVKELSDFHNKKEFFEKQFSIDLPNSVNRLLFLKTYAACCAKDYIKPEQFLLLLSDMNDIDFS